MNALLALSYADRRGLVNAVRALRHSPGRVVAWTSYLAGLCVFAWLRTLNSHHAAPGWLLAFDDMWASFALLIAAAILLFGARQMAGIFASRAEALVLVRAPLPSPLVAGYLQVRALAFFVVRLFGRFAYFVLFAMPYHATLRGLLFELGLLAAVAVAIASIILPSALARGVSRAAGILAGTALALFALVVVARDGLMLFAPHAVHLIAGLPAWHPGTAMLAVEGGDVRPIAAALGIAVVAAAAFAATARDVFPELYALSVAHLEHRSRLQRTTAGRGVVRARKHAPSARARLQGALAFVWLDALLWSRRTSPALTGFFAAMCLLGGSAFALLEASAPKPGPAIIVLTMLPMAYVSAASVNGTRLATDVRRPLFWLGPAPLLQRLGAWTFGPLWRDVAFMLLAVTGYLAAHGNPRASILFALGALALATLTRAAAVAVFALLPNALDQRGPAVTVRFLLSYAALFPVAVVAALATYASGLLFAGAAVGLAVAIAEAALLLWFAAARLGRGVERLADA